MSLQNVLHNVLPWFQMILLLLLLLFPLLTNIKHYNMNEVFFYVHHRLFLIVAASKFMKVL